MKNLWNILCTQAVIDKDSNNISLLNVIERITIQARPTPGGIFPYRMDLASFWTRDNPKVPEKEGVSRISLKSPSDNTLGSWEIGVNLSRHSNSRSKLQLLTLPIGEAGIYKFMVEYRASKRGRWKKAGEVPLEIIFNPPDSSD